MRAKRALLLTATLLDPRRYLCVERRSRGAKLVGISSSTMVCDKLFPWYNGCRKSCWWAGKYCEFVLHIGGVKCNFPSLVGGSAIGLQILALRPCGRWESMYFCLNFVTSTYNRREPPRGATSRLVDCGCAALSVACPCYVSRVSYGCWILVVGGTGGQWGLYYWVLQR